MDYGSCRDLEKLPILPAFKWLCSKFKIFPTIFSEAALRCQTVVPANAGNAVQQCQVLLHEQ